MRNEQLPRLDRHSELRKALVKHCRLAHGDMWIDPSGRHKVACTDATDECGISNLMGGTSASLAVHDPPYNLVAFEERGIDEYIDWCRKWIGHTQPSLGENASLYVWMGADQNRQFQPLPDFMLMMRETPFRARSFITMRNQRGYGTQKNWMAVRQELLYYTLGDPVFNVNAEYTDIPKILRGYYKEVNGHMTENLQRSKSETIRAGNVWVDIQQVFYRMEENVNGCYAQKPLKSAERIIQASSDADDLVVDFFAHSGSTLLACEMLGRRCFTCDIDPVYCEITIRRLENYRTTGRTGWQNGNPFASDIASDEQLRRLTTAASEERELSELLF